MHTVGRARWWSARAAAVGAICVEPRVHAADCLGTFRRRHCVGVTDRVGDLGELVVGEGERAEVTRQPLGSFGTDPKIEQRDGRQPGSCCEDRPRRLVGLMRFNQVPRLVLVIVERACVEQVAVRRGRPERVEELVGGGFDGSSGLGPVDRRGKRPPCLQRLQHRLIALHPGGEGRERRPKLGHQAVGSVAHVPEPAVTHEGEGTGGGCRDGGLGSTTHGARSSRFQLGADTRAQTRDAGCGPSHQGGGCAIGGFQGGRPPSCHSIALRRDWRAR